MVLLTHTIVTFLGKPMAGTAPPGKNLAAPAACASFSHTITLAPASAASMAAQMPAVQQLEKTASLPGVRLAVGLPDLHPGKGTPINAVFVIEGWLYPALVGNDIGCGIWLWRTEFGTQAIRRRGAAAGFAI